MFFLAIRHLLSRRRQTLLTLMGILLGTAAYVALSGLMLGFQSYIIDQLVNNDAHVRISAREEVITEHSLDKFFFGADSLVNWRAAPSGRRDNAAILNPRGWFDRLQSDAEVTAYSQQLVAQVIVTRARISVAARMIGCDPARQLRVTNIQSYIKAGKFLDIGSSGNRIVIGDGLLKKLGAALGDSLMIAPGAGRVQPFKIVAIFHLGIKALDDSTFYTALGDAQKVNGTPGRVTDIAVKLADVGEAAALANDWNQLSQEKVQSWDQANEGTMSVFSTQDIVRNTMTIAILVVAGFGIYNILSMAVNHKRRDIAILRSMGYLPKQIVQLFLIQGLILGAIGGVIGCGLGYVACLGIEMIPVSGERGLGGNHQLMVYFPGIYLRGFLLAFLSSVLASYFPARVAGNLNPIEIIRTGGS